MSDKSSNFKEFIKVNPFLIGYVRDKKKTWQELYELYDIVGDDINSWNKYLESNSTSKTSNGFRFEDIVKIAKNIDVDKVQEGITSLQKTLSLFGEIIGGNSTSNTSTYNPRPLYRRFDD
ncbi:MAG: hypothetical protein IJI49_00180 [Bacilli bacterium]|nr:hypothetical protein [Bacilli bacterium]